MMSESPPEQKPLPAPATALWGSAYTGSMTTTNSAAHTPPVQKVQAALLGLADGLHSLGFSTLSISSIIETLVYDWTAEHLPPPSEEPEEDMGG